MLKHFLLVAACGTLVSACVPGSALRSPVVRGTVTNPRTGRPVAGATVSIVRNDERASGPPLASAVSDAQGRYTMAEQRTFGFIPLYGDWRTPGVIVRADKEGYSKYNQAVDYNFVLRPFEPIHADIFLSPNGAGTRSETAAGRKSP